MWSNTTELESALRVAGLGEWAPRLAQLARRCIILVPGPIEEGANAPLGACRLGGEPDMPPDIDWPTRPPFTGEAGYAGPYPADILLARWHWLHRLYSTRRWKDALERWERSQQAERDVRNRTWPLSFIAQVDFAEVHAAQGLDGFPPAGRLLFFCDPFDWPWGKRDDQSRMRVVFTELAAERLERRRSPREFDEPEARLLMPRGYVFKPRTLRPTAWLLPPPWRSRQLLELEAENPNAWAYEGHVFSAYDQFWRDLYAQHPETYGPSGDMVHQVGGTAFSIQEPVEAECVKFVEHGPRRSGRQRDPEGYGPRKEQLTRAGEWQLVLQIDSDVQVGMEWGDVGRVYLCARKHDLAASRFDRCWMIMQCY